MEEIVPLLRAHCDRLPKAAQALLKVLINTQDTATREQRYKSLMSVLTALLVQRGNDEDESNFNQRGLNMQNSQTNISGSVHGPVLSGQFQGPIHIGSAYYYDRRFSNRAEDSMDNVDIVILTVLNIEYNAVCNKIADLHQWQGTRESPNLYAWQIGTIPLSAQKGVYSVAVGMTGRAGTNQSTAATLEAIKQWQPRYIFFVGFAGGLLDAMNGDVVIADTIHGYEYGKIEDTGFLTRSNWTYSTDLGLFTGATAFASKPDWQRQIRRRPPAECRSQVLSGEIASGDKVVDNPNDKFFNRVLNAYPKVIAVEMEGAGVANAIEQAHSLGKSIGFLMIRGISDVPRSKNEMKEVRGTEERDNWKPYASDVAAAFTVGYITEGLPVPPMINPESRTRGVSTQSDNRDIMHIQKEMDELIAPLHSKLGDAFYFNFGPIILGGDRPDGIDPVSFFQAHEFWSEVKKNLYLTPKVIRDKMENFVELKLGNRRSFELQGDICKEWLRDLSEVVDNRYKWLLNELEKET